jgi:formylglycine-generating enzyme required for sulfatase activity
VVLGIVILGVLTIGIGVVAILFTRDFAKDQMAEAEQRADTLIEAANLTTREFKSVRVASGRYKIGSPKTQRDHERDEFLHDVVLDRAFLIGVYEVTQEEYSRVMFSNPSENVGCSTCPVERVSWMDAITYCNKLSRLHGLSPAYTVNGASAGSVQWNQNANGYRLPTEAEWEVAARSGDSGRFVKDLPVEKVAWYRGNTSRTQPVGHLASNRAGMYDVSGNVVEWVWDWYDKQWYSSSQARSNPTGPVSGTRKAARGGSWRRSEVGVRLANRSKAGPTQVNNGLGFRIARNAP